MVVRSARGTPFEHLLSLEMRVQKGLAQPMAEARKTLTHFINVWGRRWDGLV